MGNVFHVPDGLGPAEAGRLSAALAHATAERAGFRPPHDVRIGHTGAVRDDRDTASRTHAPRRRSEVQTQVWLAWVRALAAGESWAKAAVAGEAAAARHAERVGVDAGELVSGSREVLRHWTTRAKGRLADRRPVHVAVSQYVAGNGGPGPVEHLLGAYPHAAHPASGALAARVPAHVATFVAVIAAAARRHVEIVAGAPRADDPLDIAVRLWEPFALSELGSMRNALDAARALSA